jgi:hypothetical protein
LRLISSISVSAWAMIEPRISSPAPWLTNVWSCFALAPWGETNS